tara:strand:+ start:5579 stop:5836 length:258 start_codon:yes stop_codon:yes gene_type:complete
MSAIHQCNDGGQDITGRATPREYVPCSSQGGKVGETSPNTKLDDDNVGPSSTNKKDKRTQLMFIGAAVLTFAVIGHYVYNKYINK